MMWVPRLTKAVFVLFETGSGQSQSAPLTSKGVAQSEAPFGPLLELRGSHICSALDTRALAMVAPFATASCLSVIEDAWLQERCSSNRSDGRWQDEVSTALTYPDVRPSGPESAIDIVTRKLAGSEDAQKVGSAPSIVTHGPWLSLVLTQFGFAIVFDGWRFVSTSALYQVSNNGWRSVSLHLEVPG